MALVNFNYNTNVIRTQVTDEGEPLFCANDVCAALGYVNPRKAVADHVDEGDVTKRDTPTTSGNQLISYVNESGLYALIFGSKLESAKEFKRWVTSEVLPSIRKTGGYFTNIQAPDLKLKFELAKMMLEPAGIVGNQLTLALDKVYKANTGESLLAQSGVELKATTQNQLFTPTELGKQISISGQKFNSALDILGYQTKVNKVWELTQLGKEKGGTYLDVGKKHSDGTPVRQLKWPMSVLGFVKELLKEEE